MSLYFILETRAIKIILLMVNVVVNVVCGQDWK